MISIERVRFQQSLDALGQQGRQDFVDFLRDYHGEYLQLRDAGTGRMQQGGNIPDRNDAMSRMADMLGMKGLIAKSILPAEEGGTILAAVDMPEGDEPKFSAVICTVPSTQADLSTTLVAAPLRHYKGRIEKDAETYASEGLVTYTATWVKAGFTVLLR